MESTTTETELGQPQRLGFVGTGWIGRHRMAALVASGRADVTAIFEPSTQALAEAAAQAPNARRVDSLEALLDQPLDGIVIATPSALHLEQAVAALERGVPVFCQKPLARNAEETRQIIAAAKRADVLLGVDLSYRHTEAMRVLRSVVQAGELGDVFAVDVVFHNAHQPERSSASGPWLASGGCVIDLGSHVVDLALWTLGFPRVTRVTSRLFARGEPVPPGTADIAEDYATALLDLDTGATVRLSCSWNLSAGQDALIEVTFYGTEGGGSFHNLNGSFYHFAAELFRGTSRHVLASPPDEWGGRAAVEWVTRLAAGDRYDPWIEGVIDVAAALDAIRGR